jgi:transposase
MELTKEQYKLIKPLLPKSAKTGRPRANDKKTIHAILFVLRTGCRWCDVPRKYGSGVTAWRRHYTWSKQGIWLNIWQSLLSALDEQDKIVWQACMIDGSNVPAKKGAKIQVEALAA